MNQNPKVFIHYSWDNELHKVWTLYLANRLISDGVDVIIDQYDLKLGSNNNYFMEKINNAAKVLLIMTPEYKIKADNRTSGVGYEYQIITTEFSKNIANNNKFIPILRAGEIQLSIPTFLQSFLHLNMRNDDDFEKNYIELLQNIYDEPTIQRPSIGIKPDFKKLKYNNSSLKLEQNLNFNNVLELGLTKKQTHKILGKPETDEGILETYWSHGLQVYYNKHWDKVDGILARRQPSGISFDNDIIGISLGDTFAEVKAKLGNPLNWGLPNPFTSFAFYKINERFLTIALWRDTPDKEYADFKIGTVYAIGYCEAHSVLACEPIVAATIEEIRANKKLSYLERKPKDYEIDFKLDFFKENYIVCPTYPFVGGGYMVTILFEESGTLVDFWLYDLSWSYLVIRMIEIRNIEDIEK